MAALGSMPCIQVQNHAYVRSPKLDAPNTYSLAAGKRFFSGEAVLRTHAPPRASGTVLVRRAGNVRRCAVQKEEQAANLAVEESESEEWEVRTLRTDVV